MSIPCLATRERVLVLVHLGGLGLASDDAADS
jgi:hypothetical protein